MWLLLAMLGAVSFGFRGILYHWTAQKQMNRNLMLFGVYSTGTIVCLGCSIWFQQAWTSGVWIGILMGVFSFGANACMYKGFAVGKASLVAILTGFSPVIVVILAYARWQETLSPWQLFAFVFMVVGILLVRYSNEISLNHLQGAGWGFLTMLFFGLTDITTKQAMLWEAELFPLLFLMYLTGAACFSFFWLRHGRTSGHVNVPGTSELPVWNRWRTYYWGLAVGMTNITGMLFATIAFKWGVTGLVSAILAMNILLFLLYVRLVLKEKLSRIEFYGVCFCIAGIIVLRVMP